MRHFVLNADEETVQASKVIKFIIKNIESWLNAADCEKFVSSKAKS